MTYYHHQQTGQIVNEQDGQIIATASESATPQQAELLAAIDGQHYSATLSSVKGSSRIDWQTIAAKFKPSAQLIRAHTTTGKPSTRLNITTRKVTH